MKTALDIQDELLALAKRHARRTGRPLRAVVEEGLRLVLRESGQPRRCVMRERSVGNPDGPDPLAARSWQILRAEIYGEPRSG